MSPVSFPIQADTPKATDGLEYTYIRKPASGISDRKELAHLWEVSGTWELSQEIFDIRKILAPEQVNGIDAALQLPTW